MVDGLDPGGKQPVQPGQAADRRGRLAGDLDQELVTDSPEKSLYLPLPLGSSWRGVDQPDAQHRARPQQPRVGERRAVVDVCRSGDAAGDRKSTRLNSSHSSTSYAVFCLKKKKNT